MYLFNDYLNNGRREASRHLRNKDREYLQKKINEIATNSKNKNVGDIQKKDLRTVTSLELTNEKMRTVICIHILNTYLRS
jgi:hypothetical protein